MSDAEKADEEEELKLRARIDRELTRPIEDRLAKARNSIMRAISEIHCGLLFGGCPESHLCNAVEELDGAVRLLQDAQRTIRDRGLLPGGVE